MTLETVGTVVTVAKQWWLKVNTKAVRVHSLDGATFPHIIKVRYTVGGKDYFKRKWIKGIRNSWSRNISWTWRPKMYEHATN